MTETIRTEQNVPVAEMTFDHRQEIVYLQFLNEKHAEIKEELQEYIKSKTYRQAKGSGCLTGMDLHLDKDAPAALEKAYEFLQECLFGVCVNFSSGIYPNLPLWGPGMEYSPLLFELERFSLAESWGITYHPGEGVVTHSHFPYILSFSYNIHIPEGSAPLVIDGAHGASHEIEAQEGVATFFLGSRFHKVRPNDQDGLGRMCLVGNIGYAVDEQKSRPLVMPEQKWEKRNYDHKRTGGGAHRISKETLERVITIAEMD